jgi:hypothetical protein
VEDESPSEDGRFSGGNREVVASAESMERGLTAVARVRTLLVAMNGAAHEPAAGSREGCALRPEEVADLRLLRRRLSLLREEFGELSGVAESEHFAAAWALAGDGEAAGATCSRSGGREF